MGFSSDVLPILLALWEVVKSILLFPFPKSKKDLNGEVVLITGAGSGLGAGIAKLMAKKGCKIICWDVNVAGNDKTVQEIKDNGGEAWGYKVDVTNRTEVYETAKKAEKVAGDVTILINNAGIVGGKSFLDSDDAKIQQTFEVNSISHFWTTKAVFPKMMEKDHGHVVAIASSAGYVGVPKLADYCASKAAAAHFTDSLQAEIYKARKNVNVTWICPYAIDTGMFEGFQATRPWCVDILKPEYVIEQVVHAIETNADFVLLPKILNIFHVLGQIMPRKAVLILMEWGGVYDAMNNFIGRTPAKKNN